MDRLDELRYLVLAAQRDGNRVLAALLRPLDVTPAQAEVLRVLAASPGPLTVRELGERLICEPGSPSRLVGSLATAGLIERTVHPDDGRAWALELTPPGRAKAQAVDDVEARFLADLKARVTAPDDVDAALRVLRQISDEGPSAQALRRQLSDG